MDKQTRSRMDKIFLWFKDNLFRDELSYSRPLNLIFEFADWIDTDSGKDMITEEFGSARFSEIIEEYNKGINKYLEEAR